MTFIYRMKVKENRETKELKGVIIHKSNKTAF